MSRKLLVVYVLAAAWSAGFAAGAEAAAARSPEQAMARQVLDATGVKGGLVVHFGCGDGRLTAALHANDSYLLHGLDADPKNVEAARKHIQSLGLYGKASVEQWSDERLPYAEGMVNLVVADNLGAIPMDEVLRVLAPLGVAYVKSGQQWTKTVKPRPNEIDEWTHFLHGPDNNAVAQDRVVDQPRHLQWLAEPTSTRSHDNLASVSAVVSSGGRVFSIEDEGSISAVALPTKWTLVARDAFNGVGLWRRPMGPWEGHLRGFRSGPTELPRRLVAVGERVYVTLGYGMPVTALDAATGQTLTTFSGTDNALEIVCHEGTLLAVVGDRVPSNTDGAAMPAKPTEVWNNWPVYHDKPPRKSLLAFHAGSGALLWRKSDDETVNLMPTTLAAAGSRVFFHNPQHLIALDEKSGGQLWRTPRPLTQQRPAWSAPTLVVYGDVVLSADRSTSAAAGDEAAAQPGGEKAKTQPSGEWLVNPLGGQSPPGELIAFSAATGNRLWSCPCRESYNSPPDVLVAGGLVWTGDLVRSSDPGITLGRDVQTGKVVRQRPEDRSQFKIIMGHHRCYRNKATDRYLILGRDGIELIDVATGKGEGNYWTRGTCQYGVMPCNGLIYSPPHSCACHIEAKLNGFNTYAPQSATRQSRPTLSDAARLEKGPAYASVSNSQFPIPNPSDWPTYRHDARRSGRAGSTATPGLDRAWSVALTGGRLSSPVAAEGKVFVAGIDTHAVFALDAENGQVLWSYTAGGRVDSPPTIHQGLVLFGCADGRIYCLRAADGKLAWRFLAAPEDRRLVAYGQLESAWPLSGSVLVQDGVLFAVAGRCTYLDGGMLLCRLDPKTGQKISLTPIDQPALPDVLSSDGSSVYLRHLRFDKQGAVQESSVPHLFSPAGFLDDSWWHRTYWFIGTKMGSGWGSWMRSGNQFPSGRLIVTDDNSAYCFGLLNQYNNNKHVGLGTTRYRLFACATTPSVAAGTGKRAKADDAAKPTPAAAKTKGKKAAAKTPETKLACRWSEPLPLQVRAMVLSGQTLFVAGPPDFFGSGDDISADDNLYYIRSRGPLAEQDAAMAGQRGALLCAVSSADGKKTAECRLESPPVFDGLIAANGRLYLSTVDGKVTCMGRKQ